MELECYLMGGQYHQVGTRGVLSLDDSGQLSFTLDKEAATRGRLKWVEKALGAGDVHDRLESGENVVVFDTSVRGKKLKWPWNFRGRVFRVEDDAGRTWTVSLVTPGGGLMYVLTAGTGLPQEWKAALSEAGAKSRAAVRRLPSAPVRRGSGPS
jgi:hypothetical protein